MFQVFEPQEFRNLEHLMFQGSVFPSIPRFNRLMFGPPGAVQASIRSTRKERSVRRHLKIGANHKVLARQTITNGKWRPSPRNPSSEIGGYLKPFFSSFLNLLVNFYFILLNLTEFKYGFSFSFWNLNKSS